MLKKILKWSGVCLLGLVALLVFFWFVWPGKYRIIGYLMMSDVPVPPDIATLEGAREASVEALLGHFLPAPETGDGGQPLPAPVSRPSVALSETDVNRALKYELERINAHRRGIEALFFRIGEGEITLFCHFDGERLCESHPDLNGRIPGMFRRKGVLSVKMVPSRTGGGRAGLRPVDAHVGKVPALGRVLQAVRASFPKLEYDETAGFLLPKAVREIVAGNGNLTVNQTE